ncbi:50S ribosomal protein L31 [Candidatus Erwinia haradaeae]|uniref:Large ribosomal subunit protein bL31 n=1 Tax=Candidatus Erwinia haradaeae TaxID=1922217 RepID=A0A451D3G7_9GAMM|nr:50S ribosomal protein L31 [Candidatus Erwinia haradaeae]VFP80202.1 50S ribosomal protein L31 [Candidatus Erwinia haradaeae]
MKKNIHPRYTDIIVRCSCGNEINTRSTICHNLNLDVCSNCHPFYTGKQRDVASGGRIDRFNKRYFIPNNKSVIPN